MKKISAYLALALPLLSLCMQPVSADTAKQLVQPMDNNKYPGVEWKPKPSQNNEYPGVEWKPKPTDALNQPSNRNSYPGVEWRPKPSE